MMGWDGHDATAVGWGCMMPGWDEYFLVRKITIPLDKHCAMLGWLNNFGELERRYPTSKSLGCILASLALASSRLKPQRAQFPSQNE